MSKSTPATPDYTATAQEQGQQNQALNAQQTYANRPDVNTPWGSLSYDQSIGYDPGTNAPVTNWTENVSLTPEEQQAETDQQNIQNSKSGIAQGLLGNLAQDATTTPSATPQMQATTGAGQGINYNPTSYDQSAQNAVWGQFQNMQLPLQQQQTESTQSQLEAQGLRPGDAAYDTQMKNLQNTQYTQDQTAQDQAVLAGQQQGSTEFNEANAAQAQGYGQTNAQQQYNNSLIGGNLQNQSANLALNQQQAGFTNNLINGIMNGQQVSMPTFPNASNASQAQSSNLLQAAEDQGNASLQTANASNANSNSEYGAIAGAAIEAASYY